VKHGGGSVTFSAAISRYSAGPIIALNGLAIAGNYVYILGNQVHPTVQMSFPISDAVFKITFRPYTRPEGLSLGLRNMKMHLGQQSDRT
jgi:hypothetical protein